MAQVIVLEDFQAPAPSSARFQSGEVIEDTLHTVAELQLGGLAVLAATPGALTQAQIHRDYKRAHPTTTGSHLQALLLLAGELP